MRLAILVLSALLAACGAKTNPGEAAQPSQPSVDQRVDRLEARTAALEQANQALQSQQQNAGNWTLWQVSEAVNAGYPQAFSAYPTKRDCLTAAGGWSFPGGKAVSADPTIWQLKAYRVRLECLPVGISPYAH